MRVSDPFDRVKAWTGVPAAAVGGYNPYFLPIESNEGPEAVIAGKRVIMLGANNYLGLSTHPKVLEAADGALRTYGSSVTGSRLLNTTKLHLELERELADFLGFGDALVFSTGYGANLAVIAALAGDETCVVLADHLCHSSILDGAFLAQGAGGRLRRFFHNDPEDLADNLDSSAPTDRVLVVTEGVFSAEGVQGRLKEIADATRASGARLLVDDAHGLGVMGEGGRGTCVELGVSPDLIVGTFSKSLASIGGWAVGSKEVIEFIRYNARPFVFTAACSPPNAAAALAALRVLKDEPWRPAATRAAAMTIFRALRDLGFDVQEPVAGILAILIRDDSKCLQAAKLLFEAGVYVNPFVSPGVPPNSALLRTSYMSTHTPQHLERVVSAFHDVGRTLGLIR